MFFHVVFLLVWSECGSRVRDTLGESQDHRGSIRGLNIVNCELTQDAFLGKARTVNSRSAFSPKREKTGGKEGKNI